MSLSFDVFVLGSYSIDLIFTGLPGLPEMGKEVVGTGLGLIPGEAYTSAVSMHRIGLKVGWAGDFGDDELSKYALKHARQEGLDESLFVQHKRAYRRISVAASFTHDRAFVTYYDSEPKVNAAYKALPRISARVVYIPGLFYGREFEIGLKLVRAKGMKVVMDGNSSEGILATNPAIAKAIRSVDIFLPNISEATRLVGTQDAIQAVMVLGELCPLVVVKAGADGAYACERGHLVHEAGIPVAPLDTTGAGDCFNSGFIRAWLDGLSLEQCLRWGNIAGGLSTLGYGGTSQVVTQDEIQKWLPYYDQPD